MFHTPASERPNRSVTLGALTTITTSTWSCRFSPTPGRSCTTGDAVLAQVAGGPMPESMSSCGEPNAPALSTTSPPGLRRRSARTAPAVAAVFHAHRARRPSTVSITHAGGQRVRDHLQVGPLQVRREVGLGGAEALAVLVRDLVGAHALLLGPVEVGVVPVTRLLPGFDERRAGTGWGCAGPSR